ncbi:restriction endonuclease subunit S [Vibrio splendidus]
MSELPKGWTQVTLENLGQWGSGGTPKRTNKAYYDGAIPWLVIGDLNDGLVSESKSLITQLGIDNSSAKLLKAGTLLIGMYGSIGKLGVAGVDCATNQAIASCVVDERIINKKYFFHFLFSRREHLLSLGKGGAQQNISQTVLKAYSANLAPLNEQIRIANKLDSILAKVDKAQASLDKIPAILKRFRQSVLAAATSGELTKEWREVDGISKDTWQPVTIDDLSNRAFDGPFGSKLKTADYTDHGIKVARLENIGHLVFNSAKETFISEVKYQDLIKNTIEHNDVLFSSFVDEEIRTCLFDERFGTYINKADCFCIRPNQDLISPEFLMYSLACKHTYEKIKKQVHGATRPRVNLRFLKSFEISLPSPEEQIVVVDKINQLFSKASKVEKQYLDAKTRLDRLTQSILAKAFQGELVLQDPNDEPAEQLLERILKEREQVAPKKTTRKRTIKAKTAEKG